MSETARTSFKGQDILVTFEYIPCSQYYGEEEDKVILEKVELITDVTDLLEGSHSAIELHILEEGLRDERIIQD